MSDHTEVAARPHGSMGYGSYTAVWAALIVLTGITVGVSYLELKHVAVLVAIVIATIKATLVLLFFMHLRYEKPLLWGMIAAVLVTYGIFVSLTLLDYSLR